MLILPVGPMGAAGVRYPPFELFGVTSGSRFQSKNRTGA